MRLRRNRSAKSGQYVTPESATLDPDGTVSEPVDVTHARWMALLDAGVGVLKSHEAGATYGQLEEAIATLRIAVHDCQQ